MSELYQVVREIALQARYGGRYSEACFYSKRKDESEHFDIWFQSVFNKYKELIKAQARAEVIEEVKEMISKQRFDMTGDSWNIREQLLKALTKLSEVEK